jgi:hypothetical protein
MLKAATSRVQFSIRSLDFFNLPNTSNRTMALGVDSGIFLGGKGGRRLRLTTLPSSVSRVSKKMWEPRRLTILWASTAYYKNSFTFACKDTKKLEKSLDMNENKPFATVGILLTIKGMMIEVQNGL